MSGRKRVIVKLTDEQQEQIKLILGKEVTHVLFQLIGGTHIIVDIPDMPYSADEMPD